MKRPAFATVLLLAALFLLAACNDGGSTPPGPTATAESIAPPGPTASPVAPAATETPVPFEGGRDPVEVPFGGGTTTPLLADVRTGQQDGFDRVVFEYDGALPGYRVEYVDEAIDCGSGEPSFQGVIGGGVFLQVRFMPAAAHDDEGAPTSGITELTSPIPARQTCDFEGVVTWVLLLSRSGPRDFRVLTQIVVEPPSAIVVDIAQPTPTFHQDNARN